MALFNTFNAISYYQAMKEGALTNEHQQIFESFHQNLIKSINALVLDQYVRKIVYWSLSNQMNALQEMDRYGKEVIEVSKHKEWDKGSVSLR